MSEPPDDANLDPAVGIESIPTAGGPGPRIELLHRIAVQLRGYLTETTIYDAVITAAADLFEVRYAAIVIRRDDRWITVTSTPPDAVDRSPPAPLTGSRINAVLDRDRTVVVDDLEEWGDETTTFERGAAICTPISDEGMIQLIADDDFTESDVHSVELLGWIVSAHLDRLALNEEADAIEEQLYAFADVQRDVLEQASHELRTPLTPILGYMELLAEEDVGSLTADQKSLVHLVLRRAVELDAALETLTSTFAKPIEEVRDGVFESSPVGRSAGVGSVDGPVLLLDIDDEIARSLAEQLRDIGYEVTAVAEPSAARDAVRDDPPATLITDLFATNGGGIKLAETVCGSEECEGATIVATSILREEATGIPLLGVSATLPEETAAIVDAAETLLGGSTGELSVLVFDATPTGGPVDALPSDWDVTLVTDIDAAEDAHCTDEYDLALVRTDGLSDHETDKTAVGILRERRFGRRLPVAVLDRSRDAGEPRYTIGGKLFVQRPLNVADLVSMLVSKPGTAANGSAGDGNSRPRGADR